MVPQYQMVVCLIFYNGALERIYKIVVGIVIKSNVKILFAIFYEN